MPLFRFLIPIFILLVSGQLIAQDGFTRADTLRGKLSQVRSCYDVTFYDLDLEIDHENKSIEGSNSIAFEVLQDFTTFQIDLFEELVIDHIEFKGNILDFQREDRTIAVYFPRMLRKGEKLKIQIFYGGKPIEAERPPWDGGFVWRQDLNEKPWIGVACEGIGASLWWPLKDHLSDEPDSMRFTISLPPGPLNDLQAVANGQLRKTWTKEDGSKAFEWFISYPINSYNVTLNIADYGHIHETYTNESGEHDLDYYVLKDNMDTARKHFAQVPPMMKCFEEYFGEYPFWNDGYALVETPYWGMEHQGAVAYGNDYKNNEFDFDFIIIHETGHEWWGNNVSAKDHGELWIHEAFCTYSEFIYLECTQGYDRALEYLKTQKGKIKNDVAILGPLDVNFQGWPDADMYYKGSWMLHSLRQQIHDDKLWFSILKDMQMAFALKTIDSKTVIDYINKRTGRDFTVFFKEFLEHTELPVLEYEIKKVKKKTELKYRWLANEPDFKMVVGVKNLDLRLHAESVWQETVLDIKPEEFEWDLDHYLFVPRLVEEE